MERPPAMSENLHSREAAYRRIQAAYDPDLLRTMGRQLSDLLAAHLARVENSAGRVLNWSDPPANIQAASAWLAAWRQNRSPEANAAEAEPPENRRPDVSPAELLDRFRDLVQTMLDRGQNLHDPRYIGHQVPAPVPLAGLFDAVGSVTNQVMTVYEMGPWATAVEQAMIDALGQRIGWKAGDFAGLVTHGGSLANLTALLTARNVALGEAWEQGVPRSGSPPVLVAHADAHYSVARSAGILGLGTRQVVRAPLDERRRLDPNRLDELLGDLRRRNHPIIAVVACACATPIGAFDPLREVADVCRRHGVWMHVDAAHGGAACFSSRYRHLVAGLDQADSLIWDAHKMLFMPALCAFVFYRDKRHRFEAFHQDAPYLFDPAAPGLADFDGGLRTVECTKRAAVFGLWGTWALFGPQLFADLVDVTFDLGRQFYEKLAAAPDFQPLHEPECNIVVFRHLPEELRGATPDRLGQFQLELRRRVIESGEFYIVPTRFDGQAALRGTMINPLTTPDHLDRLLDTLRQQGQNILRNTGEEISDC